MISMKSRPARSILAIGAAFVAAATLTMSSAYAGEPSPAGIHAPAARTIGISTMSFKKAHVNAVNGAVDTLKWTVTDANPLVGSVGGDLSIRMRGRTAGSYLGRAIDVPFAYFNSLSGGASYISGPPQRSTYTFDFPVPSYANATSATWVVTRVNIRDDTGAVLDTNPANLGSFHDSFTATELVDRTLPSYDGLTIYANFASPRPYVYVGPSGGIGFYSLDVQDGEAGFWRGGVAMRGPTGQTFTAPFAYQGPDGESSGSRCGLFGGGSVNDVMCGVTVNFPAGSAAGVWTVTQVSLYDNAGNRKIDRNPAAPPFILTSDATLRATGFSASPNPVNNWASNRTVQVTMTVTGAVGGVSAVYLDNDGSCSTFVSTPTVNPDGTISLPVTMYRAQQQCAISGIAIVDGAGNVAVYGIEYTAPDPGIVIRRIPDTTPPTLTAASLNPTTIAQSEIGSFFLIATLTVASQTAPVNGIGVNIYDAGGNLAYESFGGFFPDASGQVAVSVPLPFGFAVGTYTLGIVVVDAGNLRTSYGGPADPPVPGGPLVFTVTG